MANRPKYTDPNKLQAKVDEYFKECDGTLLTNDDGNPVYNKYGQPIVLGQRPPTVCGLAYHLGFGDKHSIYDYKAKPAFKDIITRALFRIEVYTEERLFDKEGCNGAKFSLQNNYKHDWSEKTDKESENGKEIIIVELSRKQKDETESV